VIYVVQYTPGASRELRGLDRVNQVRIARGVNSFAQTGHGDIDTMKGRPGEYRLRVGDYRVIFALDAARNEIVVTRIAHRREVYR
jgi:mRNA interferase RelE/StbE